MRQDGRDPDELRPIAITPGFLSQADGSALIEVGGTRVICTASLEDEVPPWRAASGLGWLTAEYGMLPASTGRRKARDVEKGRPDGRATEIQRLIGRSLRAVADFAALGPRTVRIDCDVLEADGGTRCAAITGGYVAAALALEELRSRGEIASLPFHDSVAAVSVGIVGGTPLLDLDYGEDSGADVDMNVVATGSGRLVEVQASAEGDTFPREDLDRLLDLALGGIERLSVEQKATIASPA